MATLDLSKYGIKDVKRFYTILLTKFCLRKRPKQDWKVMKEVR